MPVTAAMARDPLLSPDDDEMPAVVRIMVLEEVSKADRELFAYLLKVGRVELGEQLQIIDPRAPQVSPFTLMWYEARGVLGVETDPGGRLWIGKTRAMEELMKEPAEKKGGRRR
jgi:hypothetical protein